MSGENGDRPDPKANPQPVEDVHRLSVAFGAKPGFMPGVGEVAVQKSTYQYHPPYGGTVEVTTRFDTSPLDQGNTRRMCWVTARVAFPAAGTHIVKSVAFAQCRIGDDKSDHPNERFGRYLSAVRATMSAILKTGCFSRNQASEVARNVPHIKKYLDGVYFLDKNEEQRKRTLRRLRKLPVKQREQALKEMLAGTDPGELARIQEGDQGTGEPIYLGIGDDKVVVGIVPPRKVVTPMGTIDVPHPL